MLRINSKFRRVGHPIMPSAATSFTKIFTRIVSVLCLFTVAVFMSACTGSAPTSGLSSAGGSPSTAEQTRLGDLQLVPSLPAPASENGGTQTIAPNDLLEIAVFQVDDLNRTVRVDDRGQISMPLIGQVSAAGQSSQQLEQTLQARYGQNYLQNPVVTVFVKESSAQSVTMDGQFIKPGIYPVASQSTLSRSIALAGGLTKVADENKIFVFRKMGAQTFVSSFSVAAIRSGKAQDIRIYGGDVVVSFESSGKVAMQNLREALGLAVSARGLAGI
jgi:polysaccharide biosynthesis/export protein